MTSGFAGSTATGNLLLNSGLRNRTPRWYRLPMAGAYDEAHEMTSCCHLEKLPFGFDVSEVILG